MSKAQTIMASLKYKLSHVSQGIGTLICLQLRRYMKGITGSVDSRRSSNAPWSKARREYLLGRLLQWGHTAVILPLCNPGSAGGTDLIWNRPWHMTMIRKYDTKFVCGTFLCWLLKNRQYLIWYEA